MKKWIIAGVALLALLAGYVATGPFIAIRGIHRTLETRKLDRLERYVDFEALRGSLQAQVDESLLRAAGDQAQGPFAQAALATLGRLSDQAVDALVSPRGVAILLEGRTLARRVGGTDARSSATAADEGYRPLDHAVTRYESPSRFTATVRSAGDRQVVFVFTRDWFTWKLSEIRMPPEFQVAPDRAMP